MFPLFAVSYIKHPAAPGEGVKWKDKSLKCIVVGRCPVSDSLLFYHPPTKQTLSCAENYRFDLSSPAGPHFNEQYETNFHFNTKSSIDDYFQKPAHENNDIKYFKNDQGQYVKVIVLSTPVDDSKENYIVQHAESGDIQEVFGDELLDTNPTDTSMLATSTNQLPHIPWIRNDAKVTMYLRHIMSKPQQGFLHQIDDRWQFIPGRKRNKTPIDLNNFMENAESLIRNKMLFKGWQTLATVLNARIVRVTSNLIAKNIYNRKVSASNLHLLEAPTLLKHEHLHPEDKATWDESYKQEYQGLADIDTWEYLSEKDYQAPSISTKA